jgi:hypothetical protein
MKKKSHARAPDKRNFSVALPITLIDALEKIAMKEDRSRNRQIESFLKEKVQEYKAKKGLQSLPNSPGKPEAVAS